VVVPPGRAGTSLLDQALAARRGSRRIALVHGVDQDDLQARLELLRDVAALSNSGGGVLLVGVDRTGQPTGWDPGALLRAGANALVDELATYVGERVEGVKMAPARKGTARLAALEVSARHGSPLLFETAGSYVDEDGQARELFGRGTVWFRHGGKSEPARARDLAGFAHREEARRNRELQRNLRHVSTAPIGSQVLVVPPSTAPTSALERVRLVDDPSAPAVARADYDVTHPHRQKDVIAAVNARLGRDLVNAHDILSVRRVHDTDARDEWFHQPRFGSPQYTDAFVAWLVESYQRDHSFFDAAKAEYQERQLARRARR
jgi:hypothetical protein